MLIFDKKNLLKTKCLIDIFLNILEEVEKEYKTQEFSLEDEEAITELAEEFSYDKNIEEEARKFFNTFFLLVQQAPYILDPELIIKKFEHAMEAFIRLNSIIENSSNIHKQELIEFIEEYGLTIENRLLAIKNEHRFFTEQLPHSVDASVKIIQEISGPKLILNIQDTPGPLIGIDDLLNYQIKQIVEVNNLILKRLNEQISKYQIEKLFVKSELNITEEMIEDFKVQIEEDRESLKVIQEKNFLDLADEELISDIAAELATNLIYRIYWDKSYEVELIF